MLFGKWIDEVREMGQVGDAAKEAERLYSNQFGFTDKYPDNGTSNRGIYYKAPLVKPS